LGFKEESSKLLDFEHRCDGAETWTLLKIDQKYVESFAMKYFKG
jgi:hypothetical protein